MSNGDVWRDHTGKIWVPRRDKQLKSTLYAVTHQGPCGHRGKDATLGLLEPHFLWDRLEEDVEARRAQCLQCVKLANGQRVPRPMGSQMIAESAGEILMADYFLIWPSENGNKYVLLLADKLAKQVELTITQEARAVPATQSIVRWGSRHGLPD